MTILGALLAGTGFVRVSPERQAAPPPCPAGVSGTFTNVSRAIVPIGAVVVRRFTLSSPFLTGGVQLAAPPEYNATQVRMNDAYGLRLTAQRAGDFVVTATWTRDDANGSACTATASATLTAGTGSPLVVRSPTGKRAYANPMRWSWKCKADSDATPATATVRWEIDPRQLPLRSRGGKAPFKFRRGAKSFAVSVGDLCDAQQAVSIVKKLRNNAKLTLDVGRSPDSNQGGLWFGFDSSSGNILGPHGRSLALHVGITLKQGRRMLANTRACAWSTSGFEAAKGKNVDCWW